VPPTRTNALDAFHTVEMRVGGRTSSAQLTDLYDPSALVGRRIVAAMNLGIRSIAGFDSEVLVLGAPDPDGRVVLLSVEREVPEGARVF